MAEALEGEVVLITGASASIGLGMARAFHTAGALLALGNFCQDSVKAAAVELAGERTFAGLIEARDRASVPNFFQALKTALRPSRMSQHSPE